MKNKLPKKSYRESVMVAQAIANLSKELAIRESTDIENLVQGLKQSIKEVHGVLGLIDKEVKLAGLEHNKNNLRETAQKEFLNKLMKYNKEELQLLFTCVLADLAVKEFV